MAKITKTLEYRRAAFLENPNNLETLLRNAWEQFGSHFERTFTFQDGKSISGLISRDYTQFHGGSGIAIHCGRYMEGQSIGTIPTAPAQEVEVGERQPDPGENFLNSDFMALIYENHVICLNCGRNAGSLRIFLQQLFREAGLEYAAQQFDIIRIASPDKLAMIRAKGVKTLDLEVGISEATGIDFAEIVEGGIWNKFQSSFGAAFHAITGRDDSLQQLRQAEEGTMKVSLNIPNKDPDIAKGGLNQLSRFILDDDESEGFTIHLRGGGAIKSNEVSIKKPIRLNVAANSVSVREAWEKMGTYLEELHENGQLRV